jgi:hypothetical protein
MSDDTNDNEPVSIASVGDFPPQARERFEETSAALEAADLIRRMRSQALSASGVRGISQGELALRTGLSQPRISQIEKGTGRDGISYAVLRKIANACGIEWGHLLRAAIAHLAAVNERASLSGVGYLNYPPTGTEGVKSMTPDMPAEDQNNLFPNIWSQIGSPDEGLVARIAPADSNMLSMFNSDPYHLRQELFNRGLVKITPYLDKKTD